MKVFNVISEQLHMFKFKTWLHYRRYNKYIKKIGTVLQRIKNSFLFYVLKVLMNIVIVLLLIFLCIPKEAFVVVDSKDVSALDFSVNDLGADGIFKHAIITLPEHDDTMIFESNCDKVFIDGEEYDVSTRDYEIDEDGKVVANEEKFRLILNREPDIINPNINLMVNNDKELAKIKDVPDYLSDTYRINFDIVDSPRVLSDYNLMSVSTSLSEGMGSLFDSFEFFGDLPSLSYKIGTYVEIEIEGLTGKIDLGLGRVFDIESIENLAISSSSWRFVLRATTASLTNCEIEVPIRGIEYLDIDLFRISELYMDISGKLSFQRSIDAKEEYELYKQTMFFQNSKAKHKIIHKNTHYDIRELEHHNENLNGFIKYKNSNIETQFSGKVNKGSISTFDLFPSFRRWYIENIALIPISLITAIFGAIGLFNKRK